MIVCRGGGPGYPRPVAVRLRRNSTDGGLARRRATSPELVLAAHDPQAPATAGVAEYRLDQAGTILW